MERAKVSTQLDRSVCSLCSGEVSSSTCMMTFRLRPQVHSCREAEGGGSCVFMAGQLLGCHGDDQNNNNNSLSLFTIIVRLQEYFFLLSGRVTPDLWPLLCWWPCVHLILLFKDVTVSEWSDRTFLIITGLCVCRYESSEETRRNKTLQFLVLNCWTSLFSTIRINQSLLFVECEKTLLNSDTQGCKSTHTHCLTHFEAGSLLWWGL